MDVAPEAAPEIDRLVLSVNSRMSAEHGAQLLEMARGRGLDSLELLPHFADFLLAGVLTPHLAALRMRYRPPERVAARLEELENKELIERRGERLVATDEMRDLLEALLAARARVAGEAWGDHPDEVTASTRLAREVSRNASPDHEVAVAHRAVPEPEDPHLALHTLLTNLRYVRQHDHAEAWRSRGLSAPAMILMTALWRDGAAEPAADGLEELAEAGLATRDPLALTPAGRETRDEIEADTNDRARVSFAVLDDRASRVFIDSLRALPGSLE